MTERASKQLSAGKRAKGQKELRQSAVLALGQIGDLDDDKIDQDIRQALYDSMGDADLQVKNFSTIAVAQLAGNPTEGDTEKGLEEQLLVSTHACARLRNPSRPPMGFPFFCRFLPL